MDQSRGAVAGPEGSRRAWLIGAIVAAAVIAIAALAIVLAGSREPVSYEPGTPEAAIAAYAEAWAAGDVDTAYGLLSERAQARVPIDEFRHGLTWDDAQARIWIDERIDHDERVTFVIAVERRHDSLLGPDRDTDTIRLSMLHLDDDWYIDSPLVGFNPW